jgi:carboxyl-terminal processing protease
MMHDRRKRIVISLLVAALGVGAVLFSSHGLDRVAAVGREDYEGLESFSNVLAIVQKNYVQEVKTNQLVEGAINGMLSALDPHSAYLTPDLYRELQVDTEGSFGGLGIEITLRDGLLTVVSPIEDTPAYRAGVKAGDQIIKIDGELTKDMTLLEAVKRMRGPQGSQVTISVRREGVDRFLDISLTREVIKIKSVRSKLLEPGYGYVRLAQFQDRTTSDLEDAIARFSQDSQDLKGLVLDLRSNPGGLLSQAVKVADVFLASGMIVYTKGRLDNQQQKYLAHPGGHTELPLVVLVNHGSASASEIVAGAVQDHGRAVILGTQTFGKGSVQTILPLENGAALRLTTAMYYTPNGRSIQVTGVKPDHIVENVLPDRVAANRQRGIREENLRGHFDNTTRQETAPNQVQNIKTSPEDTPTPPTTDASAAQEAIREGELGKDPQLDKALELLKSWQGMPKTTVAAVEPLDKTE